MEEENGVKAPMTRLRRRLSVEQPESPSAATTPTKKRNTRLAAKPQLELIDEHAIPNSPSKLQRTTKKSISRDLAEPDEKIITPVRRSARVKSNTSLVLEAEEKPVTPTKRNTRIKSNTSIVSETTQSVNTPRAKRAAARRNSQIGSDTELSLTPARTRSTRKTSTSSVDKEVTPSVSETADTPGRTRRNRKASTSSIDNTAAEASPTDKPTSLIEVIIEEPEDKSRKSTCETDNVDSNNGSPTTRKSLRLKANKGRKSDPSNIDETSENASQEKPSQDKVETTENSSQDSKATESSHEISIATSNLIRDLDTKLNKKISYKNKSMSDIEDFKTKRSRTKSWTTLTSAVPDSNFFSDNESSKKKLKKQEYLFEKKLSVTGSGDGHQQATSQEQESAAFDTSLYKQKNNRKSKGSYRSADKSLNLDQSKTETPQTLNVSNESNKENILGVVPLCKSSSAVVMLEKAPSEIKTTVFIEDSNSNTESISKSGNFTSKDTEDQCVPVVDPGEKQIVLFNDEQNIFALNTERENNHSVEPMDIDETMPENVSLTVFGEEGKQSRKTSLCQESDKETHNKSNRKSSLIHTISQSFENENDVQIGSKKTRKSSTNVSQDNDSAKNTLNKSNRKSSISQVLAQQGDNDEETPDKSNIKSAEEKNSYSENNEETTLQTINETKSRKSSLSKTPELNSSYQTPNKSKRKSSLSNSVAQKLEKSHNENKTTLVLSQIKDVSATETNASKSPQDMTEKSVNISQSAIDGPINKKLALDYLTSTPVQQTNMEKLTMQMNTSVITPTNVSKKGIKDTSNSSEAEIGYKKKKSKRLSESVCNEITMKMEKSKKNLTSVSSVDDSSTEDSEASDEEESTQNRSNFLDEEAEDAGEDYESGDSQDEEERQYERENEILEKGETLTSEDEDSNDTDYEKDSFIVSSDEEDDELLSGSEDDLDMTSNELGMDAESKKKYNERKTKEQKKASREMYEARHGLKKSDEAKTKQSGRSRLDSTLLKSDDDNLPPKKSKRMRLESSTLEASQDETSKENGSTLSGNDEIGYKKKKSKPLSESLCNESVINEKEITILNPDKNKQDPLSMNIKVEPKTPQKDLDISTIQINEQIEQIHVDENMSMMKPNDSMDPLQATMAAEDNLDDDESISENEEIADNYDSMLRELNKEWQTPIKSHNISLNLNKKPKRSKVPIVDELNLTETKFSKKIKDDSKQANEKSIRRVFKKLAEDDDVSRDSIDLNLLFSEESNDSDKSNEIDNKYDETHIPLKRTEAKTDIRRSSDSNGVRPNASLNTSSKNKSKSTGAAPKIQESESDDNTDVFNFFIDTKGDLGENKSNKAVDSDSNEAPVEVFYVNHKNKISKKSSDTVENTFSELKTLNSEKKKKKKVSESQNVPDPEPDIETAKTPKSEKKKKHSEFQEINTLEAPKLEHKTLISVKEKKKKISETSKQPEHSEYVFHMHKTQISEQKANQLSKTHDNVLQPGIAKTPLVEKKKKKKLDSQNNISQVEVAKTESNYEILVPKTPKGGKKTRKTSESVTNQEKVILPQIIEVTGAQKRKRDTSAIQTTDIDLNTSQKSESVVNSKKKKLKTSNSTEENTIENINQGKEHEIDRTLSKKQNVEPETEVKRSKKRKQRDDDEGGKSSKVFKEHSFDKVHVPRLPSSILAQLDDKPTQLPDKKKTKVVSTTNFFVEETLKKKNKPSNLKESVYLNHDDKETIQKKAILKKPTVLPFLPTVSISDSGFTTNFRVSVLSDKIEFLAKSNETLKFRNDYINNKKIKKLGTYDRYRKQRNMKLTKY